MIIIVSYPRTMSAWLSNLLTVPGRSLFLHDALHEPEAVELLRTMPYERVGIVDTLGEGIPEDAEVIVLDNNPETVTAKCEKWGDTSNLDRVFKNIETLKGRVPTYHIDDMDSWIGEVYEHCTGTWMDWCRYRVLKNLNIQSQLAMAMNKRGKN